LIAICLAGVLPAWAQSQSYVNSSDTYNWIDASTHNRIRAYSPTYTYPENSASATVTITVASPGVVTWPAHGLAANTIVNLSTTGALPTGYTAGTTYYVRNPTATTFQLSASSGGAAIAASGTQSGTHTAKAITSSVAPPRTSPPYFLHTPTGSSCPSSGTNIDDRLSDEIPVGFTFNYGGAAFTRVRVSSNGRIQFNNNRTCGAGTDNSGATIYTYDYPDPGMNYSMRIYGADLDSTPKSFRDGAFTAPVNPSYPTNCLDDAQCYVSVATIGSAPTRKFVVTWNNVPKWVSGTLIAGNFNLQIILEEGGDFVYQFGNVVDTIPGVPAQIGWQVNANDYDIKQTALPTNNSAIRYTVARPLIQYQMEQNSWSTATGQVIDTSGNNKHGTRLGAADVTANGYSCNGANIPSNSSTGTIGAIDTGFNLNTDLAGAGTITFWYRPSAWVGASATNVNAQLLDASTATNAWFYLSKLWASATTSKLRFAVRDSTNVTQFVETAAMSNSVLSGTGWVHIGISWNFNTLPGASKDRLRIYVNGNAIGTAPTAQSLFTSSGAPITGIGTLYIGDNRSTFLDGTNGTGNSANGVIDEFRMYNLEVGFTQIQTDYSRPVGCVNHYAITHASSGASPTNGVTCVGNPVTISSHDVAHALLSTSTTINISTSTGQGNWSKVTGAGTLTPGPANSGTATYSFLNESQVYLSLAHTTAGNVNINVTDGTRNESAGAEDANLNIVFCSNPGFNGCEYTSGRCTVGAANYDRLFTKLAGRQFKLDAVALTPTLALKTDFNATVSIDLLAHTSKTPVDAGTNCPAASPLTTVIPLGNAAFANGRLASAPLLVGANALSGVSPNYSAYRDVRMRFTCDSTNCPPSGATVCSRNNFAVRPTDFAVTATNIGGTSLLNPASVVSGSASTRVAAGVAFNMSARALTAGGGTALGYNGTPQITATAAAQSVSAQFSGGAASGVTLTDYTDRLKDGNVNSTALFGSATDGVGVANTQLYYLDYGGFYVLAGGLQDASFVDPTINVPGTDCDANSSTNVDQDPDPDRERFGCLTANQSNSALVGRFSPSSFLLNSSSITSASSPTTTCPASVTTYYQGQPFNFSYNVSALSSGAAIAAQVLPRYNVSATVTLGAENNNSGTDLSTRLSPNSFSQTFATGVGATASPLSTTFTRPASPDGPFDLLDVGIRITDPDLVVLGTRNMLPTNNTACTAVTCTHQKLSGSPIKERYGRVRLNNAYGPELLELPMTMRAEYWAGTGWLTNTLDTCTDATLSFASVGTPDITANTWVVENANNSGKGRGLAPAFANRRYLESGVIGTDSGNVAGFAGNFNLWLTAPGAGNAGSIDITATVPSWLQFNWTGTVGNPKGRATFGIFKSPLIYRRENY
jgi:hypothetical protein